jgi:hypothetical protein
VPANSQAAKAGLLPTKRGFAGNIILGDIITSVDNKPVSIIFLFAAFFFLYLRAYISFKDSKYLSKLVIVGSCEALPILEE